MGTTTMKPKSFQEKDFQVTPWSRDGFHTENHHKIALDDQQTLALNELLLQLEQVKLTLGGLARDNQALRAEVVTLKQTNSRLTSETQALVESLRSVTSLQHVILDDVNHYRPPTVTVPGGNIEERLRALESLVSYNKQILTSEVLQFGCPARTSRLGLEVCSIKNNQNSGLSSSISTPASPSSS